MTDDHRRLLYLVRHGEAKPKDEDPERPLTTNGAEAVGRVASWAAAAGILADEIWHSGKLRAQETAQIFAQRLAESPVPKAVSGLAPNDDVEPIAARLQDESRQMMIVGHLPFLERIASLLVAGDANARVFTLDAGALLALEKNENVWSAVCLVQPRLLPGS